MALGALTGVALRNTSKPKFVDNISFAGDTSYPTGGSAFDALFEALVKQNRTVLAIVPNDCGGYHPVYSAGLLKVYRTGAINAVAEQVPNATNLSAVTFNITVISE
jgi:hypothetical protein